jgi:hypothetical protein
MPALYKGEDRRGEPGMRVAQLRRYLEEVFFSKNLWGADESMPQHPIDNPKDLAVNEPALGRTVFSDDRRAMSGARTYESRNR